MLKFKEHEQTIQARENEIFELKGRLTELQQSSIEMEQHYINRID